MADFLTLETTQGPVVVRRLAIDMVVPVSEAETVVTVGAAQLVVKATLEELELGVTIPKGWFRPLADAPDKLAAMRAAGVSARAPMVSPQPRAGRAPVPITPQANLPQRQPPTRIAPRPAPAPRPRPPARDGADVAPDLRAQVEATAKAAANAINPELTRPPQASKREERRSPVREGVQTVPPKQTKASQPRAAKAPSRAELAKPSKASKPQRATKARR